MPLGVAKIKSPSEGSATEQKVLHDSRKRPSYGSSIALDKDARITAIKVNTLANLGGILALWLLVPTYNYAMMLVGPYSIPNVFADVTGVYTNTHQSTHIAGYGKA